MGASDEAWDDIMMSEVRSMMEDIITRLQSLIESEGKSCSFDPELITPEYVFRMWGGSVAIDEIATGLTELRKQGVYGSWFMSQG